MKTTNKLFAMIIALSPITMLGMDYRKKERRLAYTEQRVRILMQIEQRRQKYTKNSRTTRKENHHNYGRSLRGSGKAERDERAHINDVYESFKNFNR